MKQLSIGELIAKLEAISPKRNDGTTKDVSFDFGSAIPTTLDSWRGDYSQLALGYDLTGYDSEKNHMNETSIVDLLAELKSAIGKTFEGWKGGEYTMDESTDIWVANSGNSSHTAINDVTDIGWCIIINTFFLEY